MKTTRSRCISLFSLLSKLPTPPGRRALPAVLLCGAVMLAAGCGSSTLPQDPTVAVAPISATVQAGGGQQQFTATVTGVSDTSVVWRVNGVNGGAAGTGTITPQGLYSAPATVPSGSITVSAVSAANANYSASASVTVTAAAGIAISPATATIAAQGTQQFTATVTNVTNTAVVWSVNGTVGGSATVGTISAQGLYTAPATFPGLTQVTIGVASVQDPSLTASATVTLQQPVTVAVAPAQINVNLGATQTFVATVTGTANTAVTWTVNGIAGGNATVGTIDATGKFTAPSIMPAESSETITATSQADTNASGSAQILLTVPASEFQITPANTALTLNKADTVSQTFQLTTSPGFSNTIQLTLSGLPVNVAGTLSPTSMTASGAVNLQLTSASISLAASGVPITITATSTDSSGNAIVQTATVLLTITGWAGHVRTLAGGPGGVGFEDGSGTADELEASTIGGDGGQNLYFADRRGSAFRSYGIETQTVTTLAGGPYNFTFPDGEGMAWDTTNQVAYVADGIRNQVVVFKLSDGTVTVLAGAGTAGYADGIGKAAQFSYPRGLALSPDDTTLYVADTNNEVIRAINIASGTVTTIAGQNGVYRSQDGSGKAASFCQPTGMAIDGAGANLYITDGCGYVIRKLALAGDVVTTIAGSGNVGMSDGLAASATFDNLGNLKVDPHDNGSDLLYIADDNAIRVLTLKTPTVYTLAGGLAPGQSDGAAASASFYDPYDFYVQADAVGTNTSSLFIADEDNGLLRRLDFTNPLTATSSATAVATVMTLAGQPSHRGAADGDGTGTGYTNVSQAEFDSPSGIVTDGKIAYMVDSNNGGVREIDLATTAVTTVAGLHQGSSDGPALQASFYQPAGLAWLPNQNVIYVADTGNGSIRKLDLSAQTVTTLAGAAASGYVDGALLTARFNHPYGIVASADASKLYIADTGNNAIRVIDLNAGMVSTLAGGSGLGSADGVGPAARFAEPAGIVLDATGTLLYVADFENHAIRQVTIATGAVTTIVGMAHACGYADGPAAGASLCSPALIASDGRSLFWGDSDTGLLRVLDIATGTVSTVAGAPGLMHMVDGDLTETPGELTGPVRYNGVFALAVAPDDSVVLFADKTANVIRIIY